MSATTGILAGRHAVVTGGGRGIGLAITHALLDQGARVTITGRNRSTLEQAAKHSPHVECSIVDVAKRDSVNSAFREATDRFGPIHILVNNAGQAGSAPFLKTDEKLWRQMMSVNVDGAFHCTQAALPDMLAAGWGRIINIASIAGLLGQAYITAYCASKHALVGFTKALAIEVGGKGITVNAVCPGYTESDMVTDAVKNIVAKTGRTPEEALNELVAGNPLKRLIRPEEVANAVTWLCMPSSEAVNGQAIAISGGEV